MSDIPPLDSANAPHDRSTESRLATEEVRPHSPVVHHADSYSLSALFLLTVTVAALLGFASNALPGRTVVREASQITYTPRDEPWLWFATGALLLIGILVGGRAGYLLKRQFTTMLVGIFYGMVASAVPAAALFHPPSWTMILFSCGMLFAIGILLGPKAKKKVSTGN